MTDEKRKFTRVAFKIFAEMQYAGKTISGRVSDLSLKGLFIHTTEQVELGEEMEVTLRLPSTSPPLDFRLRASVARVVADGIGMEIVESDLQAFTHIRNIVAMHLEDPDQIMVEFLQKK